jgi:hypothetical protein
MGTENTSKALANMTDAALFERLATSVLREHSPDYHAISHTGINTSGKTVKSPVDGITYVTGANPPHAIFVHHATSARKDLEKKWLHDPKTVTPKKRKKPTAPAGDLIKTIEIVQEERKISADLEATLILTSNEEPDEAVTRKVESEARKHNINIEFWTNSRLSHFLDNKPAGQWLRKQYLDIDQELLSKDLLLSLSEQSLKNNATFDDPDLWVECSIDEQLLNRKNDKAVFLSAGSGLGKTVACFKRLKSHIENGGYGIILNHDALASATSIEQAIATTLKRMHPQLDENHICIPECTPSTHPFLVIVEDVNKSGQATFLLEKLGRWIKESHPEANIQIICPIWPTTYSVLEKSLKDLIEPYVIMYTGFSENEGQTAVACRVEGRVSAASALAISKSLGHDPLLISLFQNNDDPNIPNVIEGFVENQLRKLIDNSSIYSATQYYYALIDLAYHMLKSRTLTPNWRGITNWFQQDKKTMELIASICHQGLIMRFSGPISSQSIDFRHDRVLDWILSEAISEYKAANKLDDRILEEPYFSNLLGLLIISKQLDQSFIDEVLTKNPLALFYALQGAGNSDASKLNAILDAIKTWLDKPETHLFRNAELRWHATALLAETDHKDIPNLISKIKDWSLNRELARLRNGDIAGGIAFCISMEPFVTFAYRDAIMAHSILHHEDKIVTELSYFLSLKHDDLSHIVGALRLAGHIGNNKLVTAIETCWQNDANRSNHLGTYIWSYSQCCHGEVSAYMDIVCKEWLNLSDKEGEYGHSPRSSVSGSELAHALQNHGCTDNFLTYFIAKASLCEELKWPITYLLHGVNKLGAILFVVDEFAKKSRKLEGTDRFSPSIITAGDKWRRRRDAESNVMITEAIQALSNLWLDKQNDKHTRYEAFKIWKNASSVSDLSVLQNINESDELYDQILVLRLELKDVTAIPALIKKIDSSQSSHWWHSGKHIQNQEFIIFLDAFLTKQAEIIKMEWGDISDLSYQISDIISRLYINDAERILLKHWNYLQYSSRYILVSLYIGTPELLERVRETVGGCPDPKTLFKNLSSAWGIKLFEHPGITRKSQIAAITPYLHLLEQHDVFQLWQECNEKGWYEIRRQNIDAHLDSSKWHVWSENVQDFEAQLDSILAEDRSHWIDREIEEALKAGWSWESFLENLINWFNSNQSMGALSLVASALCCKGSRGELQYLKIYKGMPEKNACEIIENTKYAVMRRTLH